MSSHDGEQEEVKVPSSSSSSTGKKSRDYEHNGRTNTSNARKSRHRHKHHPAAVSVGVPAAALCESEDSPSAQSGDQSSAENSQSAHAHSTCLMVSPPVVLAAGNTKPQLSQQPQLQPPSQPQQQSSSLPASPKVAARRTHPTAPYTPPTGFVPTHDGHASTGALAGAPGKVFASSGSSSTYSPPLTGGVHNPMKPRSYTPFLASPSRLEAIQQQSQGQPYPASFLVQQQGGNSPHSPNLLTNSQVNNGVRSYNHHRYSSTPPASAGCVRTRTASAVDLYQSISARDESTGYNVMNEQHSSANSAAVLVAPMSAAAVGTNSPQYNAFRYRPRSFTDDLSGLSLPEDFPCDSQDSMHHQDPARVCSPQQIQHSPRPQQQSQMSPQTTTQQQQQLYINHLGFRKNRAFSSEDVRPPTLLSPNGTGISFDASGAPFMPSWGRSSPQPVAGVPVSMSASSVIQTSMNSSPQSSSPTICRVNSAREGSRKRSTGRGCAPTVPPARTSANAPVVNELPFGFYEGPEELAPTPINPVVFDIAPENAKYFVIKSFSEEDVHASVKYAAWSSTEGGNARLDHAFREQMRLSSDGDPRLRFPVYLFFSVNASGHFCGMAQMMSCVDMSQRISVWQESDRWRGMFRVKWIFLKDIPNSALRFIRLPNNENKPVTNSRDTQEIPDVQGRQMLALFYQYRHRSSLISDLHSFDVRQRQQRRAQSLPAVEPPVLGPYSSVIGGMNQPSAPSPLQMTSPLVVMSSHSGFETANGVYPASSSASVSGPTIPVSSSSPSQQPIPSLRMSQMPMGMSRLPSTGPISVSSTPLRRNSFAAFTQNPSDPNDFSYHPDSIYQVQQQPSFDTRGRF